MLTVAYPTHIPVFSILRDSEDDERIERLRYHISAGDYFPFLATIVGMLKETAEDCAHLLGHAGEQAKFADMLRDDLIYLHEHYELTPKERPISYSKKKVVRFTP